MTLAADIAGDFLAVADNLEAALLKRPGTSTVTVIPQALRRALSTREAAASAGKYTTADVVWHLPATYTVGEDEEAVTTTVTPYVAGQITNPLSTEIYTILEVHRETFASRWRCVTRDLAIVNGLDQLVTILRKKTKRGTGGAAEYTETEQVKVGFKAKVHVTSAAREIDHGRRSAMVTANLFMSEPFELDNEHLIEESDGTRWEVVSYLAAEEIGQLPQATLERHK